MRHAVQIFLLLSFLFSQLMVFAQKKTDQDFFDYGTTLFSENLYDLSAIQFEQFINEYAYSPLKPQAAFLLAESYFQLKKFSKAHEAYFRYLIDYPQQKHAARAQYRLAECFEAMEKMTEAIASYQRVFHRYPESEWANPGAMRSAALLQKSDQYTEAKSAYEMAIRAAKNDENRSNARLGLAGLLIDLHEFEEANRLLALMSEHASKPQFKNRARLRIAEIQKQMGHWDEAQESYRQLALTGNSSHIRYQALSESGRIYNIHQNYTQAIRQFEEALKIAWNDSSKFTATLLLNRALLNSNTLPPAISNLSTSLPWASTHLDSVAIIYLLGRCYFAAHEWDKAIVQFEMIDDEKPLALLYLAASHQSNENVLEAVRIYKSYLHQNSNDDLKWPINVCIGRLYMAPLSMTEMGLFTLHSVWEETPNSFWGVTALYHYFLGLQRSGRYSEAWEVRNRLLKSYPGFLSAEFEPHAPKMDYQDALQELGRLTRLSVTTHDQNRLLLELGRLSQTQLMQPQLAADYYRDVIRHNVPGGEAWMEACYKLGYLFYHEAISDHASAAMDSAKACLRLFLSYDRQNSLADDATLMLANLSDSLDTAQRLQLYTGILDRYPQSDRMDEILFRLGERSPSRQARDYWTRCAQLPVHTPWPSRALYGLIQSSIQSARPDADSLITDYVNRFKNGEAIHRVFLLKGERLELKDINSAILNYEYMRSRFAYTDLTDTLTFKLAGLYTQNRQFSAAEKILLASLKQDSVMALAIDLNLVESRPSNRIELIHRLADVYRQMGQHEKAVRLYHQLSYMDDQTPRQVEIFQRLAAIAEEDHHPQRAKIYLEKLFQALPSDSTAMALGDLHYRLSEFEEAVPRYQYAVNHTDSPDKKIYAAAQIVLALIKQGKLSQADVRIGHFQSNYKKVEMFDEFMASFYLERGRWHLSRKNFDSALAAFEEVTGKYKRTSWVPYAQVEIGKTYLITNKTEDALRILTGMPNEYPGHEVLNKVFLNLGDHYFRSKQYDNAMRAFQMAALDSTDNRIRPVAMRYLIRVYESLRIWDSAIHVSREYLRLYPDADDSLDKRVKIGTFFMQLSEFDRAIEILRDAKTLADAETEAEIQYWIGKCFFSMGRFQMAIFEFLKVNYLSKPTKLPWDVTALYEAGLAYLKLNEPQNAKSLFEKIVKKEGAASDLGRIARQRIIEIEEGV